MTIRCNNCMTLFEDEEDLEIMEADGEYFRACSSCKTDGYLMDVSE